MPNLFKTTTSIESPLDASLGRDQASPQVSDFLTIQSLTNFAAMTGAITAAWNALIRLNAPVFSPIWVPYGFAVLWGMVSILASLDGLTQGGTPRQKIANVIAAIFIAVINALILASAVVGATVSTSSAH